MRSEPPMQPTNRSDSKVKRDSSPSLRIFPHQLEAIPASETDSVPEKSLSNKDKQSRELDMATGVSLPRTVTITLGQVVPLLIDAVEKNRVWIEDFSDERVVIDADLYEVLLAYQRMRNRDAA